MDLHKRSAQPGSVDVDSYDSEEDRARRSSADSSGTQYGGSWAEDRSQRAARRSDRRWSLTSAPDSSPEALACSMPALARSSSFVEPWDSSSQQTHAASAALLPRADSLVPGLLATDQQAALNLSHRLTAARQTVDFVQRKLKLYSQLSHGTWSVWEVLQQVPSLHPGGGSQPALHQALATAEACRAAFPQHDWLHLVGLLHGLGALMLDSRWGAEPLWAVSSDSFVVGCGFPSSLPCAQHFHANPDRRRRQYSSLCGQYSPGCGMAALQMSWTAAEYLHLVLSLNRTSLPPAALFLIRYQQFPAVLQGAYDHLLSQEDRQLLPLLQNFRQLLAAADTQPLLQQPQQLLSYYGEIMERYGCQTLQF